MSTTSVTVVVVNWNSGRDLDRCLPSVLGQTWPPLQVVLVDNDSSDDSLARARDAFPAIEFVALGENTGFCGGANAGIARARGDAVLVLNPDVWLEADFLERAMPALDRDSVGFVAAKVLRADGLTIDTVGQTQSRWLRRVIECGYGTADRGQFEVPGPVDSVCGAVALYGPRLLARLAPGAKLFDEDFFAFWEDADVGARARRAGLIGWYEPRARAYHRRGGTQTRETRLLGRKVQLLAREETIQYHILKNRYLFLAKNESVLGLLARAPLLLVVDGAVLLLTAILRPRVFRRLLGIGPLLRRAWSRRRGVVVENR